MSATFNPDHICFFDFETKSGVDLQDAGAVRYACDPKAAAVILTYAIGRRPVELVVADDPGEPLVWDELPDDFRQFYDRALGSNTHKFAAHNDGFDRSIWNYALINAPELYPEMVIDTSVQATAAGLPPDLAGACQASGSIHKVEDGKKLIGLFCEPKSVGTPQKNPIQWMQFCNYAIGDIDAMRSLFLRTRQLPLREWKEYWSMEQINDRGIGVDLEFARKANALAKEAKIRSNDELHELTNGAVTTVGQVKPLTQWLIGRLPDDGDGMKILTKREEEVDEYGTETRPAKYSLTRSRVEKLIPYCESIEDDDAVRALQIRLYGGSTTPAKYGKILAQQVDGTVYGQYVFNGAPQTGRASSRGVQIQNLARSFLPYEHEAIEAILNGADYDELARIGSTRDSPASSDTPVVRKLALLIRPTFVPKGSNQFVVSDFSQIEARVLPWLVGPESKGALARLQIFRDIDADPSLPDLYTRSAAAMSGLAVTEITKALRQRGKVAELALGFGGGVGALAAMGANYGLYLPTSEAKDVVDRWRKANPWCVRFWGKHDADTSYGLWGAVNKALEAPGATFEAGRVSYVYLKQVLGGTLYCQLPSGRCLAYRGIKYERVNILDDDDKVVDVQTQLRFWKGRTRSHIWHGTLCENIVQATAADLLRGTLVRCEDANFNVRLHSHDEILTEVGLWDGKLEAGLLRDVMRQGFDWSEGLPLMSEETIQPYYSKWEAE
jgi:DNA polymerase